MTTTFNNFVDNKNGLLNRTIFVDKEIYQQELEQIFGRCWQYLGHESQIPNVNDFLACYMGEDPVLLTRDSKGKLHAFLNMCRHRGNRICRADKGNAPSFMCTYHGWTFATDGKLVGVPGYKEAYFEELDRSQWGLVEAGQIHSYRGLVFATWDKQAPNFTEYLGDMEWYLDVMLDRRSGGTEVIGGVHRWVMEMNWKFPVDNHAGDGYHVPITHGSRGSATVRANQFDGGGNSISPGNGHGIGMGRARTFTPESRPVIPWPADLKKYYGEHKPEMWPALAAVPAPVARYYMEHLEEQRKRLGNIRTDNTPNGNWAIFPNLVHNNPIYCGNLKIFLPRGPQKTEAWEWTLVDKEAPKEYKDMVRTFQTLLHGPSGIQEADDQVNFLQCTAAGKTLMGSRTPINQQLGIGHEFLPEEYPGKAAPSPSELNQRAFYGRWAELMDAGSWAQVSMAPKTK